MEALCSLNLFGIKVQYPSDWRIVPDSSYSLNFDSGLFRFEENVQEKRSRVSMGLRWECSNTDPETFLTEFGENIEQEYRKAIKGKARQFELLRNEIVINQQGVPMRFIETQYRATQSLVNNPQKMQRLRVCNVALYCKYTHRMVICSLVTTPQFMEENCDLLTSLLLSVQTEPVHSPDREAQRMQKRAAVRQTAARRAENPLAQLKRRLAARKYSTTEENVST